MASLLRVRVRLHAPLPAEMLLIPVPRTRESVSQYTMHDLAGSILEGVGTNAYGRELYTKWSKGQAAGEQIVFYLDGFRILAWARAVDHVLTEADVVE